MYAPSCHSIAQARVTWTNAQEGDNNWNIPVRTGREKDVIYCYAVTM